LDDLGLVSTGKPAGSRVKPAMGTGTGTAKNTRGLPVQFTNWWCPGYIHGTGDPKQSSCQKAGAWPRPSQSQAPGDGFGLAQVFTKPEPHKAMPRSGLLGQARPKHH